MIQKKWFWIEHLPGGGIGKTGEADAKGRNGSVIRYYEAVDLADACSQAKAWYAAYSTGCRATMKRHREKRKASGRCVQTGCTRNARPGRVTCRECADALNARRRDKRRRTANGDSTDLRRRHGDAEAVRANVAASNSASKRKINARFGGSEAYRLSLILRKFDELGPVAFRAWLVSKIPAMLPQAEPGQVRIPPGPSSKKSRIDWFESSLEKATAAE